MEQQIAMNDAVTIVRNWLLLDDGDEEAGVLLRLFLGELAAAALAFLGLRRSATMSMARLTTMTKESRENL